MFRGIFSVEGMSAALFCVLIPLANTSGAADNGNRPGADSTSATMDVSLVIPPRIEIGNGGRIPRDAGPGQPARNRNLCVSSNSGAFTVMAIGKNPEGAFSPGPDARARGYRLALGGRAMNPGERMSLPPRVRGLPGCTRGYGMELEVSLPRTSIKPVGDDAQRTDVLTLVFAAT